MNSMKAKLHLVFTTAIFFVLFSGVVRAQTYWKVATPKTNPNALTPGAPYFLQLDQQSFYLALTGAATAKNDLKAVFFPDGDGTLTRYLVRETAVMHPELSSKYPQIASFTGWSKDHQKKVRFSISHRGVQVMLIDLEKGSNSFIQKESRESNRYVYRKGGAIPQHGFACRTPRMMGIPFQNHSKQGVVQRFVDDQTLRKFRIAVSASGEYTTYHGGTVADALAAINATLTRVNEVFETDLGITLELIANNEDVIFIDPETDPYSGGLDLLLEVEGELDVTIGSENFDVGHLFHLDVDNGNAGGIGTVCNSLKGRAFSAALIPETDLFDLDYVAHELGHQFGANHTWSFQSEGTGVQAEPASGTTIMGYAGIVDSNNVAPNGDDYYHYRSIQQISEYVQNQTCSQDTELTNNVPTITENSDYSIPAGTAFMLMGNATDSDVGDNLTYTWEQIDDGTVTQNTFGPDNPVGANFRSLPPSADPIRYFPRLSRVVSGQLTQTNPSLNSAWETVSTIGREMNFGLTVRDNAVGGGQVVSESVVVTVVDTGSPFRVTSQSQAALQYEAGAIMPISWDVANTNQAPVDATQVDVFLSTDGGLSFPIPLASAIPNTGNALVQLPGGTVSTSARIMITASNNIFFAVNSTDFEITASQIVLNFDLPEVEVCKPDNVQVNFTYETYNGFSGTTTLSATVPDGTVASFSTETVSENNTAVGLSITGVSSLDTGQYPVQVTATSGGVMKTFELSLEVFDSSLGDAILTAPANLAMNTSVNPVLQWEENNNHTSYDVEVATDIDFTTIVASATIALNTFQTENLLPETTYYWRVRPNNNCGTGTYSDPFSFNTLFIDCATFTAGQLPVTIPETDAEIVTSEIQVNSDLIISEVSVALAIEHTFLEDLEISLISPQGTTVVLISSDCGSSDDINATFDDNGIPLSCSNNPAITGTVQPILPLSILKGESTLGIWTLEIQDMADLDGGALNGFSLTICAEGMFIDRPDADGDGVFDDGDDLCLDTPSGVPVDASGCPLIEFPTNNFAVTPLSETCVGNNDGSLSITATDTSIDYTATLSGNGQLLSQNFTQNATFEGLTTGNYELCIVGSSGMVSYQERCFEVVVPTPEAIGVTATFIGDGNSLGLVLSGASVYSVVLNGVLTETTQSELVLNLVEGNNTISVSATLPCQGSFEDQFYIGSKAALYPNPVANVMSVQMVRDALATAFEVYSADGQWVMGQTLDGGANDFNIDVSTLSAGLYYLVLITEQQKSAQKFLKR